MAQALHLDRRAKTALGLLVAIVLGLIALVIRSSTVALTPDSVVGQPMVEKEDELVQIGRLTLMLKHGGVGNKIAHWVNSGSRASRAFEVHDRSFAQGSDALTSEGQARVSSFAQMMNAVPALKARILVVADSGDSDLARRRSVRLQSTLVSDGVLASRVTTSSERVKGAASPTGDPELVLILSK